MSDSTILYQISILDRCSNIPNRLYLRYYLYSITNVSIDLKKIFKDERKLFRKNSDLDHIYYLNLFIFWVLGLNFIIRSIDYLLDIINKNSTGLNRGMLLDHHISADCFPIRDFKFCKQKFSHKKLLFLKKIISCLLKKIPIKLLPFRSRLLWWSSYTARALWFGIVIFLIKLY